MAELEELEQEDLDAQLLEVDNPPLADDLPSVPTAEPSSSSKCRMPFLIGGAACSVYCWCVFGCSSFGGSTSVVHLSNAQ